MIEKDRHATYVKLESQTLEKMIDSERGENEIYERHDTCVIKVETQPGCAIDEILTWSVGRTNSLSFITHGHVAFRYDWTRPRVTPAVRSNFSRIHFCQVMLTNELTDQLTNKHDRSQYLPVEVLIPVA